ncbi:hypothetical protein BCU83_14820 [Vibrio breoganii]|uniref:hypothetical protein n=1 Tax=Vibrio breoganii TaxID=553239 RepID=UPI000C85609B|nr:hypothetical protein [Vibrio breoganii]PMG78002.1 hypothetical protein BCU83_14820 [Vibrio breoganii]
MTKSLFNSESSYVVMTRKHLSRLVLPYEVILDSLCYRINESTVIDASTASSLVAGGTFTEDLVLLEITRTNIQNAYSLSGLMTVWFATHDAKELFVERGYENFDIESINCEVVSTAQLDVFAETTSFIKAENPANKLDLVKQDGILALAYEQILSETDCVEPMKEALRSLDTLNGFLSYLLSSQELSSLEQEVQSIFAQLCIENSLDSGWDTYSVLNTLNERLSALASGDEIFKKWQEKAKALVSGAGAPDIPLNDNGSHVLRAIILVLLNPELENLVAIKSQLGDGIGDGVFKIAKSFVSLRSGYSLLDYHQRERIGDNRAFIQDLNASLYNEDFSVFGQTEKEDVVTEDEAETHTVQEVVKAHSESVDSSFVISSVSYLTEAEEELEGFTTYSIDGLVPNAGFNAKLVEDQDTTQLSYWLIDRRSGDGKFKGKIGLDLLQIQSNLPSDFRFEVNANGVFLRLTPNIGDGEKLKEVLTLIKDQLTTLKAVNVKKSNF